MNSPAPAGRGRWTLVALFALFVGPILIAMLMGRFNLLPTATKAKGELLSPKPDLRAFALQRADGSAYQWEPEKRLWRVLVLPAPGYCEAQVQACATLTADLHKVWQLFGKDADHAQLLWFGAAPSGLADSAEWVRMRADEQLYAALPKARDAAGIPVYVVDPNGFVVLHYQPGFDPADLRYDVAKLLKLA